MKFLKLLLTIAVMASINLSAAMIWQADFESPTYQVGTLIPQESWEPYSTWVSGNSVTNDNVYSGAQSLRLYLDPLGDTDYSMVYHAFDVSSVNVTSDYVKISCAVWPNTTYDGFRIYNADKSSSALLNMGTETVNYGGGSLPIQHEAWNTLSVTFDVLNQKAIEISANDAIASINESTFVPAGVRLSAYIVNPWPTNSLPNTYFDDVMVETVPAFRVVLSSANLLFLGDGSQVVQVESEFPELSYACTLSTDDSWITVDPTNLTVTGLSSDINVSVDTTGLELPLEGSIEVTGPDGQVKVIVVQVRSSLIAYEGFDNSDLGECYTNFVDGTGFTSPWTATPSTDGTFPADENIIVEGLEYSTNDVTLITTGNAAYIIPSDAGTTDNGYVLARDLEVSLAGDRTVWVSMLLQAKLNFNTCDKYLGYGAGEGPSFGEQWSASFKFVNGNAVGAAVVLDQTYFIVTKYVIKDGQGIAYMFINPDISKEPSDADATGMQSRAMGMADLFSWRVNHNHSGTERGALIFDELRIGDTWDDVVPVNIPTNIKATDGTYEDRVEISWNTVPGASDYSVYRALTNDSTVATLLEANITTNVASDTTATPVTIYYYWVKSDLSDAFSDSDDGYRAAGDLPVTPENLATSQGPLTNSVMVTWDVAEKATKYMVFRSRIDSLETATDISGEISTNMFDDSTIDLGVIYYYWVKAGNDSGWSFATDSVSGYVENTGSLICYDGFDGTLGTSIVNVPSGIGWSEPTWSLRHAWNTPLADSDSQVVSGLEYSDNGISLVTSGNAILIAPVTDGTVNEGYQIQRSTFSGVMTNGVFWESYLWQPQIGNLGNNDAGIFTSYTSADNGAFFGAHWSTVFRFMNGSETGPEIVPGETYFVVVKIDKDNETGYAWVNPDLSKEPSIASAVVESRDMPFGGGAVIHTKINSGQNGPASYVYDEYRLGYEWDDVAPNYGVKNVQATDGTEVDKVALTWTLRADANTYVVYRNTTEDSSTATAISGDLTTDSYDDTTATPGEVYYYWVLASYDGGIQSFSGSDAGYRNNADAPAPPANLDASDAVPDQKYVEITYDAVTDVIGYRVYRSSVDDYATAVDISGDILGTSYQDTAVQAGVKYYYWARAQNASGWSNFGDSDSGSIPAILVAYYAMNELDSTNMFDSSDNDFPGIYRDEPTLGVASADAVLFETAVQFDVSDATINSNTPIRDLLNNFTVAMWVKPDEFGTDEYRYLMGVDSEVGGWSVQTYNDEVLLDITGKGSAWTGAALSDTEWTHVAFTFDYNNTARVFIDGIAQEGETKIGIPADYVMAETYIANGGNDQLYFGSLDEIRVYAGVATDALIAELANVPEPATLSLMLLSLVGFFAYRRR